MPLDVIDIDEGLVALVEERSSLAGLPLEFGETLPPGNRSSLVSFSTDGRASSCELEGVASLGLDVMGRDGSAVRTALGSL